MLAIGAAPGASRGAGPKVRGLVGAPDDLRLQGVDLPLKVLEQHLDDVADRNEAERRADWVAARIAAYDGTQREKA